MAFSTLRGGAGTGVSNTSVIVGLQSSTTTNQFAQLHRALLNFDTSDLGGIYVDYVVLSVAFSAKTNSLGDATLCVVGSTISNAGNIVTGDFVKCGTTVFASKAFSDIVADGATYNDFTLDTNGINQINTLAESKFALRLDWDVNNSFTGTWASNVHTRLTGPSGYLVGSTPAPKLTVTFSSGDQNKRVRVYRTVSFMGLR